MDIGYILDNRYEIIEVLGSGGMGKVYLGRNIMLDTLWAIKELSNEKNNLDNVFAEVDLLKRLEHSSLPKVFEVIKNKEAYYVVFTYIKGTSLSSKLAEVGYFSENTVIDFGMALCDVLTYLHTLNPKPIIYRDLKPSNIMLCPDGSLKLIDFGIAREFKEENYLDTVFIGTRGYAAPEQYGEGQSGQYTDIYSLGVTLKQLLTGKSPLESPYGIGPVRQINPQISRKLELILEKCTNRDIESRYGSTAELRDELAALAIGHGRKVFKTKKTSIEIRTENLAFYKQVIVSLNNGEFTSELAIGAAMTGLTVLLVDLVKLASVCDFYLGISKKFREYRILTGLGSDETNGMSGVLADLSKFIYKLNPVEGLSYIPIDVDSIDDKNAQDFLSKVRVNFDIVIINTSIEFININNKSLFINADKIITAGDICFDRLDFWRRTLTVLCLKFEIEKNKVSYVGWLFKRDNHVLNKMAKVILADYAFYEGITFNHNRQNIVNNCIGPAFTNYRDSKHEYGKILNSLRIAPVNSLEKDFGSGILGFLHRRRS